MRGHDDQGAHLFSYVSPEQRVPADHPLRGIRQMTDRVLATLSRKFTRMYSDIGLSVSAGRSRDGAVVPRPRIRAARGSTSPRRTAGRRWGK